MNRSLIAMVLGLTLLAAACGGTASGSDTVGGSDAVGTTAPTAPPDTTSGTTDASVATTTTAVSTTTTAAASDFPVTVTGGNGEVVIEQRPEAIVSLSPTATEMLFAIGAGDQVAAVDSLSDYPAQAPITDLSAFEPNVEAIAELGPDLVVLSFDPGDVVASLGALGIPTLVQFAATTIDDTYAQMGELGTATGNIDGAAAAITQIQSSVDDIVASLPETDEPVTYYHELDDTYYSVATSTFVGEVYALLGMVSIADAAADLNFGYPQLSAEFILEEDPDVILLADTICCGQTTKTLSEREGWGELSAVKSGAVVELDDSVASRWGPRIVDLLVLVSEALLQLNKAA